MTDRIFIKNLRLRCRIGITDEERAKPQDVITDVSLITNLKRAGTSDNLDDIVNYSEATQRISQFASRKEFKLLESLAEGITSLALETTGVEPVIVRVQGEVFERTLNWR